MYRVGVKFRYGRRLGRALVELGYPPRLREGNGGDQREGEGDLHDGADEVSRRLQYLDPNVLFVIFRAVIVISSPS